MRWRGCAPVENPSGGERAEAALSEIAPHLKLSVRRLPIRREPHPTDLLVWLRFMWLIWRLKPDVLHGHGAKAGAFIDNDCVLVTARPTQQAGFDEVILYFNVGLKPHAQVKDEMARFMAEVAPNFADHP